MPERIAFVSYETPFAPSGGIAAVMGRLPAQIAKASRLPVYIITPYHHKIPRTTSIEDKLTLTGKIRIPFEGKQKRAELLQLEREVNWVFIRAADMHFFAGQRHPYDLPAATGSRSDSLLRDALFFGQAVPAALPLLGGDDSWVLMLQDWEAATAALALTGQQNGNHRLYLTLHNSYDHAAPQAELLSFGIDPDLYPGNTILQSALSVVERPVFTVSDQFGRDFQEETLQSVVLAPHLKATLSQDLLGINNGVFTDLSVPAHTLKSAQSGDFSHFRQWKAAQRAQAMHALDDYAPSPDKPVWGNLGKFKRDDAPWFVMAGRDDPRQKGYDVACSAITDFLIEAGEARFLFFPIPGDEALAGLGFLKKLSEQFPESVLVLPFIFQEGYFSALQGASFGIMPSLYEPFGMANEFYLKGTPGIGRATGGIIQQIVPLRSAAAFSHAVQVRTDFYYGASAKPTGILFRERDRLDSEVAGWLAINAAAYDKTGKSLDRLEERSRLPLFQAMSRELRLGIEDGIKVYTQQSDLYYEMLTTGISYIQNTFSWERAAQEYLRVVLME
jgi:glycogen synthase